MKRTAYLLVVGLLACGCVSSQPFVNGVDVAWSVIGPEYEAYVDADTKLAPDSKATRKATAAALSRLIAEAKAAAPSTPAP